MGGWGGSCSSGWTVVVLYLSESTASDNPASEDAFMDSLFLKVSLFLTHKGPKAVWQRTPGCRGQKLKSGQRRDRETEKERKRGVESKKPLLPGSRSLSWSQNGLIPLYPAVLPHFGRPLPCGEEEKASYLHQITFLYTPPH